MNICKRCGEDFIPIPRHPNQFYCSKKCNEAAYYARNKVRINVRNLANYYKNQTSHLARRKEHRLSNLYGLTSATWKIEFENQGRCCAICKSNDPGGKVGWHTDHDHKTGKFRGIVCLNCNHALGAAKDRVDILVAMIEYLQRTKS